MASSLNPAGSSSPTSLSRTLEKVFDDAQHTSEINLSGRKLKEYPKLSQKYDLSDTITADFSRNRLSEVPPDVCDYASLEKLNFYHNVLRCIPEAIAQLRSLVHLNLSRNQLTTLPPVLCQLESLEILLASNNKLVSLPEEVHKLQKLMELDVSCNEIAHIPKEMADMSGLRRLNLRRNLLVELPQELSQMSLEKLDVSGNRISSLPYGMCKMETLTEISLNNNPLTSPPSNLCGKGQVHVMKYLHQERVREERKLGVLGELHAGSEHRRSYRKSAALKSQVNDENRPDQGIEFVAPSKRGTIDSGYSSSIPDNLSDARCLRTPSLNEDSPFSKGSHDESQMLALRAEEAKRGRQSRKSSLSNAMPSHHPRSAKNSESDLEPAGEPVVEECSQFVDEFTRELQRQKSDYELKKKRAEQLRRQVEEEEKEKNEKRRAAQRLTEDQRQANDVRAPASKSQARNQWRQRLCEPYAVKSSEQDKDTTNNNRKPVVTSTSFREENKKAMSHTAYRRANSDTHFNKKIPETNGADISPDLSSQYSRNNGVHDGIPAVYPGRDKTPTDSPTGTQPPSPATYRNPAKNVQYSPAIQRSARQNQSDEFRHRHEMMIAQQRREAENVRRRMEDEKQRIQAGELTGGTVYQCVIRRRQSSSGSAEEKEEYVNHNSALNGLPTACRKGLDAMAGDLNSHNPSFTIRRQLQHAQEQMEQIEQLRHIIETRLKMTLPDDLPGALRDGVVLCHLANHIRPRSVPSIHVPSPAVPKLPPAKCRKNVENFLEACRRAGVDQERLCTTATILEERDTADVALSVKAFLDCAFALKLSAV